MAAIGSPTVPVYFDANGIAKQCRSIANLAYTTTAGLSIVIGPSGSDDNIETQYDEIVRSVPLANRTPLYSINGAVRLAARFSVPERDTIYIHCQDGTYTWNVTQYLRGGKYFNIRPLNYPTSRPAISTRSVKFVFNATSSGDATSLGIMFASARIQCIAFKNNTNNNVLDLNHAVATVEGCVLEGGVDGVDGQFYTCNLRSYLIGSNRTYSATEVDTSTAIETYIFGQSHNGFECDCHSYMSIVGWVRIKHTGTNGYAINLPRFGHLAMDATYAQRIDILESGQAAAVKFGYYNYITCGNTAWRCNLADVSKLSTIPINDISNPVRGVFNYNDDCTYTKVTNPLG